MEAKPPFRFRKLRIAWSVGWGLVAVLLVVLWVRSYWRTDSAMVKHGKMIMPQALGQYFLFASNKGSCACLHVTSFFTPRGIRGSTRSELSHFKIGETHGLMGFDAYWRGAYDFGAFAPHWFLVALVGTIAALSWLRCRFSLRAVLFATTLVAVVLGLIVYAVRK